MFMWGSMLVEGSELNIEIHKKHSRRREILMLGRTPKEELMCKVSIRFDDLWKHLSSGTETSCEGIFTLIIPNLLRGPQRNSR